MKKLNTAIAAIILLLTTGCSDREDGFRKFNSIPSIKIVKVQGDTTATLNVLSDSIRFVNTESTFYNIKLKLSDADDNLYRGRILIDSGKIQAYYKGNIMLNPSLRVDNEYVELSLLPQRTGNNQITFRVEDKFNDAAEAKLNLYVFENLLPIAKFEERISNAQIHEYEFNGTSSFDQDYNYGGKIVSYEWNINGLIFTTPKAIVKHVFPKGGTYKVRLRVMDNNNAFSQIVEKQITI